MKNAGFTLVEIIIAVAVAAIFLPAIGVILSFALSSASGGENFSKAYSLAQEGMEAIYYIKSQGGTDWQWTSTSPENLSESPDPWYYQPIKIVGEWQLGTKTNSPIITNPPFTRKIKIIEVQRCGADICSGGMPDPLSRKTVVYVTWPEKWQTQEVKLESYVTAH